MKIGRSFAFALGIILATILNLTGQSLRYSECTNCPNNLGNLNTASTTEPLGGFTYGASQEFLSSNIQSDFGRRAGNSRWHLGVDFSAETGNLDVGDALYPIETGIITDLINFNNSYKVLVVRGAHRFGYGHIFFDGTPNGTTGMRSGDFILKNMDGINSGNLCIIYAPNGGTAIAFGPVVGTVTHPDVNQGNALDVTDRITNINTPIAPVGNSGGDFGAHLHLYNFRTDPADNDVGSSFTRANEYPTTQFRNPKDPLQFLDYVQADYTITIDGSQWNSNGVQPSSIRVRCQMDGAASGWTYANTPFALDGVELYIRKSHEAESEYQLFKGSVAESKIFEGSNVLTDRYPSPGFPSNNTVGTGDVRANWAPSIEIAGNDVVGLGSYDLMGIQPFAYNNNLPYDNYYFSDLPTRIHKQDNFGRESTLYASINSDARYPDGKYNFKANAHTLRDIIISTTTAHSKIFDNFKPYVKSVIVRNFTNSIIYVGKWSWDGTQLELSRNLVNFDNGLALSVEVTTSEPMLQAPSVNSGLTLRLDALSSTPFSPTEIIGDTVFTFSLPALPIAEQNQPQTLYFNGYDLNSNQLDQNPQTIAVRTGATTWTAGADPGEDSNFILNSGDNYCSLGGNIANSGASQQSVANSGAASTSTVATGCNYVDIQESKQNPQVGEAITLTAITGPYTNLSWDFGGDPGYPPLYDYNNKEEVTVVFTNEIDHTITLDIDGELATKVISVGASEPSFSFVLGKNRGSTMQIDEDVDFYVDYFIGIDEADILSYQWDFGNGAEYPTSTTASVDGVSYDTPGPKTITLTACTALSCQTVSVNNFIYVSGYPFPINASTTMTCPTEADVDGLPNNLFGVGFFSFEGKFIGGDNIAGNETFYWTYGDGGTSNQKDAQHTYKNPGMYNITFTVCDLSGCFTYPDDVSPYPGPCILNVPESRFPTVANPNFTINGNIAANYDEESIAGSPYFQTQNTLAPGIPLVLNDASTKFSGTVHPDHIIYTIYKNNVYLENHRREKNIVLNTNSVSPGDEYQIHYTYGNGANNQVSGSVIFDCESGLEYCEADISSLSLSSYCWEEGDALVLSFGVDGGNCSYGGIQIWDEGNNLGTTTSNTFTWPSNQRPSSFPYHTTIRSYLLYCPSSGLMSNNEFDITIYGPEDNIDVTKTYNICNGASTSIGVQPTSGLSYEWSGSNTEYLSSTTDANPVFTGLVDGTYNYTLNVSNLQSGCAFDQGVVTINVGNNIGNDDYVQSLDVGSAVSLRAPFDGDGSSYEFLWSPTTYLDNPRVANPIFTAPTSSENIVYTVTASFRDCTATGTADIEVINYAPENLTVDNSVSGVLKLSWTDVSIESKFVIQRNEDGGGWETIDEVGSNVTTYTDAYCLDPDVEYCYRVQGFDFNNAAIIDKYGKTYSNIVCERIEFDLTEKWETTFQGIEIDRLPVGDFYDYDDDNLLLMASEEGTSSSTNLATFLVNKETGMVSLLAKETGNNWWVHYEGSVEDHQAYGNYVALAQHNNGIGAGFRRFNGVFIYEFYVDFENIFSNGNEYYVFGSSSQANANVDFYYCGGFNRKKIVNVVAQVITQDLKDFFEGDVILASSDLDDCQNIFRSAVGLKNGNILMATDVFCYEPPGPNIGSSTCYPSGGLPAPEYELELLERQAQTLAPVNKNTIIGTPELNNHKLILADNNNFLLIGTAYDGSSTSPTNQRIWFSKFDSNLNQLWEKELKWNTEATFFDKIEERKPGEYVIVGHTGAATNNLHVYSIDDSGITVWESHTDYIHATRIFDTYFYNKDNLVIGAAHTNARTVSLKLLGLKPDLTVKYEFCGNVGSNESFSRVGASINIAETCSANFELGSSTNLEATTSITLHPGTWIKEGAYFSANATEMITVGDCSDFGLETSRVSTFFDEEFETPAIDNNLYLVYPNPSTDQFQIELNFTEVQEIKLSLYDINGRMVWSDTGSGQYYYNQVRTAGLGSGLYLLRVESSSGEEKMMRVLITK